MLRQVALIFYTSSAGVALFDAADPELTSSIRHPADLASVRDC
jgi:hypothetical protein